MATLEGDMAVLGGPLVAMTRWRGRAWTGRRRALSRARSPGLQQHLDGLGSCRLRAPAVLIAVLSAVVVEQRRRVSSNLDTPLPATLSTKVV